MYDNLYNSLSYNLPTEDIEQDDKDELFELSNDLDPEKREIFFYLILHDYNKFNPNTKVVYPYKTKQIGTDSVEIKLDCLPIRLKRILLKFVRIVQTEKRETEVLNKEKAMLSPVEK